MTKQNLLQTFLLGIFAISGPLAKWLSTHFGMDNSTIEFILNVGTMGTPLASAAIYGFMNTLASKIAAIKAMKPEQQAQVAAALPVEAKVADAATLDKSDAVKVATALPDASTLAAVNAMPDVTKVITKNDAKDGVGEAMRDSALQKVVPQSAAS